MSAKRRTRFHKEAQKVQGDRVWALGVLRRLLTNGSPPPKMTESTALGNVRKGQDRGAEATQTLLTEPRRFDRMWDR